MLVEIAKCYASHDYGINKYFKTYDRAHGNLQPFNMYPKRVELINSHKNNRFNLIYKSRQVGGSTLLAAMAAMVLATSDPYEGESILILSNRLDMSFEFIEKVRGFLRQLPREFWGSDYVGSQENIDKDIFITNRKTEVILPNGSRIKGIGASRDALRGYRPTWVIIDEAAFISGGVDMFGMLNTMLGVDGRITLISTPNGYDKLFYRIYSEALENNNPYNINRIMWYEDPRFNSDLTWVKGTLAIKESRHTTESYKEMERGGYKPTSTWYRTMVDALHNPHNVSQELDARFI